jgi:hypothetical protein
MKKLSTSRYILLSSAILALSGCRSMDVPYAPVKNQGVEMAVLDPMSRPLPNFNGLRYSWGSGAAGDSYQIVVDLNTRQMAWSRRTYQVLSKTQELTGVKYKTISVADTNRIVSAANAIWESEAPLTRSAATEKMAGLTLYAAGGNVVESCCGADEAGLGAALRNTLLEVFAQ